MGISPVLKRFMHSFRVRIFLALTLIILVAIPGTGYFCYVQARKVIEKQMHEFALGSADQISKRVESFLSHHTFNVKLLKTLFESNLIDMTNDREILRYFSLFQKDHPEFFNINFGDETGRFLMSPAQIPEVHKTFDPRIRPWYQGALTTLDIHWTDVYLFASTRKPGMTVSVPIYDAARKLQAVCGIDIDISSLSKFLKGIKIGNQGVAYIFENKKGRVIAHPGLAQLPWESFQTDLLRSILTDFKTRSKRFGMSKFDGNLYFTAYTDYPDNDWTVGVTLPVSDFFQNVASIRRAIITLVMAGILVASLLSYLIAMTIVRPLTQLKQGIDRISSGDLAYKVKISDPDIAATLAASFNQMASSLDTSTNELKRTYAALAQKEKLAAVGQMTAGIAHEIKNPLGIIQGSAQVVSNPSRPLEMREKAAQFIMEEVDRLNNTLTAFLDFAKPPSPELRALDLKLMIDDILIGLREQHAPGYQFETDIPSRLPPVLGDSDQLRQVFLNLIINGIKAMPQGGAIKIRVDTGTKPDHDSDLEGLGSIDLPGSKNENHLMVWITDQGCGITQEQIKTIFDPFVSFRDKGIGLGLSIVSQIIRTHRGQLKIDSKPGKGTEFLLILPFAPQEEGHGGTYSIG